MWRTKKKIELRDYELPNHASDNKVRRVDVGNGMPLVLTGDDFGSIIIATPLDDAAHVFLAMSAEEGYNPDGGEVVLINGGVDQYLIFMQSSPASFLSKGAANLLDVAGTAICRNTSNGVWYVHGDIIAD